MGRLAECGRLAKDLVGLAQRTVLALQRLELVSQLGRHTGTHALVDLRLFHPFQQRVAQTAILVNGTGSSPIQP